MFYNSFHDFYKLEYDNEMSSYGGYHLLCLQKLLVKPLSILYGNFINKTN